MAETTFIRTKKERDFTMLNNTFLRDETLSASAKGVFAYLLFLPEDWTIYSSELCKHFSNGKDSIRNIIKELEEHGYIQREQAKAEKGRFAGYNYKIIECPCRDYRDGKSAAESPYTENPPLPSTNNKQVLNKINTNKPTSANAGEGFPEELVNPPSPKKTKSKFGKEQYMKCISLINQNRDFLKTKGVAVDETKYTYPFLVKRLKGLFESFGYEDTLRGIANSVNYNWLVSTARYSVTALLSDSIFPKCVSKEFNNQVNRTFTINKGPAFIPGSKLEYSEEF